MKKYLALLIGVALVLSLAAGCTKRPVAYTPKDATETAICAYVKQHYSPWVVTQIKKEEMPPNVPQNTGPISYAVIMADPSDASKFTMAPLTYDEKTKAISGPSTLPGATAR